MLAVDTNVLVRFLVRDHPRQSNQSKELMEGNAIWVPKTVLLESEWVLRRSYSLNGMRILDGFRQVLGLPNVLVEDAAAVANALEWFGAGMDFADALHLASGAGTVRFATFDRKLAAAARRIAGPPVQLLS